MPEDYEPYCEYTIKEYRPYESDGELRVFLHRECGTVVFDKLAHDKWHEELEKKNA
jgi:hypothetical protein